MNAKHFDITEICAMLNITSRTLRFYEQKGIIASIRTGGSCRRQYTAEQVDTIKNILILRKLGLSIRSIKDLQEQNKDLKSALFEKRAEIGALIDTKLQEITLLNQALDQLHRANSIDELSTEPQAVRLQPAILKIVNNCNDAVVNGYTDILYRHLSDTMKDYMPPAAYEKMREDTLKPLGLLQRIEQLEADQKYPNILHQYIRYEHLGLKISYVFIDCKIHGLWLGYYEL